jgi:hypothetical protein
LKKKEEQDKKLFGDNAPELKKNKSKKGNNKTGSNSPEKNKNAEE